MSSFLLCAPAKGAGALLQAQHRSHQRRDAHAASGREEMLSDTFPPPSLLCTHTCLSQYCAITAAGLRYKPLPRNQGKYQQPEAPMLLPLLPDQLF